jgi:hypothetical protein
LSLGVIKNYKNTERKINFKALDIRDDNSMVKVNNVKIDCYYNDNLIYSNDNIINRSDYDSNILELNKEINLNENLNNKLNAFSLRLENKILYPFEKPIIINKQYDSGFFSYTITPYNTDFGIDLSKHSIYKTLYLNKSKDSLFGEPIFKNLDETYD